MKQGTQDMALINKSKSPIKFQALDKSLARVRANRRCGNHKEGLKELLGRFRQGRRISRGIRGFDEGMDDLSLAVLNAVAGQIPTSTAGDNTDTVQNVKFTSELLSAVAMFLYLQADRLPHDSRDDTSRSVSDNLRVASLTIDLVSVWLVKDIRKTKTELNRSVLSECVLAIKKAHDISLPAACRKVLQIARKIDPKLPQVTPETLLKYTKEHKRSGVLAPVDLRSKPREHVEELVKLHLECLSLVLDTVGAALSSVRLRHRGE